MSARPPAGRPASRARQARIMRLVNVPMRRLLGRDITAEPELIGDPDQVQQLLETMVQANPTLMRFVRIPRDADGRFDPIALEAAVRHGFRIVRWHLDPNELPNPD